MNLLPKDRRALWLPLDDALISGPTRHLADPRPLLYELASMVDGVICFTGTARRCAPGLAAIPRVVNLTASTVLQQHTSKVQVNTVEAAVAAGASAVAVHINVGSPTEQQQMQTLGAVANRVGMLDVPVVAIAYSRTVGREGQDINITNPKLVAHAVRVAVELGADVVKTTWTGSVATFADVVGVALGVPVLVAGGPLRADALALEQARDAVAAGAAGVAYGRQIHQNTDPVGFVRQLREALDA